MAKKRKSRRGLGASPAVHRQDERASFRLAVKHLRDGQRVLKDGDCREALHHYTLAVANGAMAIRSRGHATHFTTMRYSSMGDKVGALRDALQRKCLCGATR